MARVTRTTVWAGLLALGQAAVPTAPSEAQEAAPPSAELARVVEEIEQLNGLRERLASTFLGEGGGDIDEGTFRQVCQPVGERAAALSREHGWQVRQMAIRYRNPAHQPDAEGRRVHRMMERHEELRGLWSHDTVDGREGIRYFRRITVRRPCLACHGTEDERPAFVKERYPDDRAHGFEVGDLRGVYSVFLPSDEGG